jgi:hypothetical protein
MNTPLVPSPLLDSILLVEQLGERFLWIDRLCIMQDDEETKLQEINGMGRVYGNAFLAIIAATGDNAEAGLQGVHTDRIDTVQVIEEILLGSRLVLSVAREAEVHKTKYESRAWTYVRPTW